MSGMSRDSRPLWICPECGARLVSRNLSHSCGLFTFEALFAGSEPPVRDAARALVAASRELGDVQVIPQKTRLVFVARVRFASLMPRKKWVVTGFALHRWVDSPRVIKTEDYGPRWRYHFLRVADATAIDDELRGWLRESHDVVGMQEDLFPPMPLPLPLPLSGGGTPSGRQPPPG
jgi:hypothetical protein